MNTVSTTIFLADSVLAMVSAITAFAVSLFRPEWYYSWLDDGSLQTKILKVDSEAKLQALSRDAFARGINPAKIYDAGKTQLPTFTVLGIGPAPEYKIDSLIKDLKSL
jgi:peptidyl-tRNA hydrolase